jgi:BatD DUF11 like domain
MRHFRHIWRYSSVLLLIAGTCCHVWAQNVVFSAEASANKMGIKDQVQVQYTIRDARNMQTVTNPASPDFNVLDGPFTSRSFYSNGQTQSETVTLTYIVQPTHEGTCVIPPITAKDAAGHSYQSNAVAIQVVPGSLAQPRKPQQAPRNIFQQQDEDMAAMLQHMQQMQQRMQQMQQAQMQQMQQRRGQQPQQQQQAQQQAHDEPTVTSDEIKKDLFIKVTVDKNKVRQGEQITASYKLYSRIPMQANISKLPSLNGFWTQDFEIPRQAKPTEEVYNGKKYQVFLLKKSALFPQQTGTLELDPAEAKGVARIVQQVRRRLSDVFDPFGAGTLMMNDPVFNSAFFNDIAYRDVKVDLQSDPVKITVTPLPDKDKPEGYGGAVGQFTIASKIDKQELTTDDVATLTYTITGSGNLKLIEAPKPTLPNGLETYDPQIIDTITGRSTTISGSKIISYSISPHTPGDYDIPGIAFTYFNPQSGQYVTEHTQPIKLHVKQGKHYSTSQAGNVAMKDIHDNVLAPQGSLAAATRPMLYSTGYWSMYALPLLAFVGMVFWKKRDDELSRDVAGMRRKRANKVALQRLVTARNLLQQGAKTPFYEEVSKAIWLYLSDKLNIPLSTLSRDAAAEALTSHNISRELQKELNDVIWECETALYASGGSKQMEHTYATAVKVISDLEDTFKA